MFSHQPIAIVKFVRRDAPSLRTTKANRRFDHVSKQGTRQFTLNREKFRARGHGRGEEARRMRNFPISYRKTFMALRSAIYIVGVAVVLAPTNRHSQIRRQTRRSFMKDNQGKHEVWPCLETGYKAIYT